MDGIVVVFEVTVYDSETRCPVMFCQHDSYKEATDYVRRQLSKPHNARYDDIAEVVPVVEGPYRVDEARERMEFILSLTLEERGEVV